MKNRLTVVPPGQSPPTIAYGAFDDFADSMDWVLCWFDDVADAIHTLENPTASREALEQALATASSYEIDSDGDDEIEKCRQFASLFDPPSNYEDQKQRRLKRPIIAARLAKLVNCFPNSADGQKITDDYAAMLIDEVTRKQPNFVVLEATCRNLVRTLKFVPSAVELLDALREQQELWQRRWTAAERLRERKIRLHELAARTRRCP